MAHFALDYRYVGAEERAAIRPRRLEYLRTLQTDGTLVMAGPRDDAGGALDRLPRRGNGRSAGPGCRGPLHGRRRQR